MQILADLMVGVVHLLRGGVDVLIVCLLAHCLALCWPQQLLVALDTAGRPVVDAVLDITTDALRRVYNGHLHPGVRLGICLLWLTGLHALFSALVSIFP